MLWLMALACKAEWKPTDPDGDGIAVSEGDCWDQEEGPPGSGLTGGDIFPGAPDAWYDGVDADCAGNEDFDADGDGYVTDEHAGLETIGVEESGQLPGGDCWDDPSTLPEDMAALNGFDNLSAASVNPDASDRWYDGIDQDCAGDDDFDQDLDGFQTAWWDSLDGTPGDDCFDATEDVDSGDFINDADLAPGAVYPGATDTWYDGTDQNCDGNEYDQDGDGYDFDEECNDADATIFPNTAQEIWDNCIDENCDGNAGDTDLDGYLPQAHIDACPDWESLNPGKEVGDCWDDDSTIPTDFDAINGKTQPGAGDVNPGAVETYYDGVDQNCDDADDFDADGDGENVDDRTDRDGLVGPDCDDTDGTVYTGAAESWYDGTDQNCDGWSDYDQDFDGDDSDSYGGGDCCDSGSCFGVAAANINSNVAETLADGIDYNCDNRELCYDDGDADGWTNGTTTGQSGDLTCALAGVQNAASASVDCNDSDSDVNPGESETVANNTDDNCDGNELCYEDQDNDNWTSGGTVVSTDLDCTDSTEEPTQDTLSDCNDSNASVNPDASETVANNRDDNCDGNELCYEDEDNDGWTSGGTVVSSNTSCTDSGEEATQDTFSDCNDTDPDINQGESEIVANGTDENCDGNELCYDDTDNDGWTSGSTVVSSDLDCTDSGEEATQDTTDDCNDNDPDINPAETEIVANGVDENCDTDELCYDDTDNDTWTSGGTVVSNDLDCTDSGEEPTQDSTDDCNDNNNSIYPGATEVVANGTDENCDTDELCYDDTDNDGWTSGSTVVSSDLDCTDSGEEATQDSTNDCNDNNNSIYPGATEIVANGIDENCDTDELCYDDTDNDSWTSGSTVVSDDMDCSDSGEEATQDSTNDCNDNNPSIYPGATEIVANGTDENCDTDELCYDDTDNDGWTSGGTVVSNDMDCTDSGEEATQDANSDCVDNDPDINPGESEIVANGIDENCDTDELCYEDQDNDNWTSGGTIVSDDLDCSDTKEEWTEDSVSDCNDGTNTINPGASDGTLYSGIDNDCDDYIDEDGVSSGDLILNEFMADPTNAGDAWFEVLNIAGHTLYLDGWEFVLNARSSPQSFCVSAGANLTVSNNGLLVFCESSGIPGVSCDYIFGSNSYGNFGSCAADNGSFVLDPTSELDIDLDGSTVDTVDWDGWTITVDTSLELDTSRQTGTWNNFETYWCDGVDEYVTTTFGTPGGTNDCN